MKFLKVSLYFIGIFLAFITIIISVGSAVCKFSDLPGNALIQACGYVTYPIVLALASLALLSFLLFGRIRMALSYLGMMFVFALLLSDLSFNFLKHKMAINIEAYDDLKVAALNVRYYLSGIENITDFIKNSDFDLVLLSESVLNREKIEYLKDNLKVYTLLTDDGNDLSLLSRYPVLYQKIVELPTYPASLSGGNDIEKLGTNRIHRSFIHAVVNVKGTPVNVLSIRLIAGRPKNWSIGEGLRWGRYLLGAQNEELSVFLTYLRSLKGPVIFGGDLNVTPNSAIIHRIKQFADDSYLDTHAFGSSTFSTSFPMKRVDYIFHSVDVIAKNSEVIRINLSDHFPLRAEFLIKKENAQAKK